ncbi:hypothetical protein NHX12_030825 [Muraenolepis orangiensis]|uniref:Uncharacterized protein n=1 Tax=Muraenolepis orangiensis TaxID=630683 RepID=A0A9Q0EA95_9TELE|nr:hypothetical protein NHX12_030825 [Muraenolepis orangiensis]
MEKDAALCEGVTMDDLDHSIHIVEYEWVSFYEECEECSLRFPSIACVENSNLSDSDESLSQDDSERCDSLQTTAAKTNPVVVVVSLVVEHGPSSEKGLQVNQNYTDGQVEDLTAVCEEGFLHTHCKNPLECPRQDVLPTKYEVQKRNDEVPEMVNNGMTRNKTLFVQQTISNDVQQSPDDGACDMSMFSDLQRDMQRDIVAPTTIQESDPLTVHKADLDMNDKQIQCTHDGEKTRSVPIRKEKERWFVTMNVRPLQRRRRKKKNTARNYPPCGGLQKPSPECSSELELNKGTEVEGGNSLGPCEPSQQHRGAPVAVSSPRLQIQDLTEAKREMHEDSSLCLQHLTLETCPLSEAAPQSSNPANSTLLDSGESQDFGNGKGLCSANICNSSYPTACMLPHAVILKCESIKSLDSMESKEFESADEFSSSNVSDCESYASAPDITEDIWLLFKDHRSENKPDHCTLLLSTPCDLFSESDNVPHTDDDMLFPFDIPQAHSVKHVSHDHESWQDLMPLQNDCCATIADREYKPYTESAMPCPPVGKSDILMLENNTTSANETPNLMSQPSDSMPVESCSFATDQLQSLVVCDPTETPCSVADSPEAYAESLGCSRPVYAMSAFWDEMEKLTIRDILQLRKSGEEFGREALQIHDTARPHEDDPHEDDAGVQTDTHPQSDTVECLWSDTASGDPSDIADSDYFTNPDDSKPDRSSCDVSTFSDLDEEYWQLLGSSRDTSPDLPDTNLHMHSTAVSPVTRDSKENTTPVNDGTYVEQSLDDPHSFNSFFVRGIQKSKSMHNVQTLTSTSTKDTPFEPILQNGDNSVLPKNDLSTQKIPLIKVNDVLIDQTLSTILSNPDILDENYRISFPEVFEYPFEENKTDCRTVCIYDDRSPTSLCDCTCSRYGSEGSLLSVNDSQWIKEKPIPIFTFSRPSVRDLTFPGVDYLVHPKAIHVEPDVESDNLPVGVASSASFQGVDPVPSSAALFNKRGWSSYWNRWFSIRKIHCHDSGSSWCRRSWPGLFPIGAQRTTFKGANVVLTLSPQRRDPAKDGP